MVRSAFSAVICRLSASKTAPSAVVTSPFTSRSASFAASVLSRIREPSFFRYRFSDFIAAFSASVTKKLSFSPMFPSVVNFTSSAFTLTPPSVRPFTMSESAMMSMIFAALRLPTFRIPSAFALMESCAVMFTRSAAARCSISMFPATVRSIEPFSDTRFLKLPSGLSITMSSFAMISSNPVPPVVIFPAFRLPPAFTVTLLPAALAIFVSRSVFTVTSSPPSASIVVVPSSVLFSWIFTSPPALIVTASAVSSRASSALPASFAVVSLIFSASRVPDLKLSLVVISISVPAFSSARSVRRSVMVIFPVDSAFTLSAFKIPASRSFAEDTWIISPACAFSSGPLTLRARSSVPIFPVPALRSILPAVISFSPSAAVPVIPFALICAVFPAFTFSNSREPLFTVLSRYRLSAASALREFRSVLRIFSAVPILPAVDVSSALSEITAVCPADPVISPAVFNTTLSFAFTCPSFISLPRLFR